MATRLSKGYYGKDGLSTNAQQVLANISNKIRGVIAETDNVTEKVARDFAIEARNKLANSGYTTAHLVDNIEWTKRSGKGYYTVGFRDNEDKSTMYYLEYGTGFVGDGSMPDPKGNVGQPHPEADKVGWEYAVGQEIKYAETDEGKDGWFYEKSPNEWKFTSGLRAVAYMYNTFQDAEQIVDRAVRESKIKSIIKGGR